MSKVIYSVIMLILSPFILAYITWPLTNGIFGTTLPVMTGFIGPLYLATLVGFVLMFMLSLAFKVLFDDED